MKDHPLRDILSDLPANPGVYQFLDSAGNVLYVGKARCLRDRVRSYFADDTGRGPGIEKMVRQASDLRVIPTDSEIEAIILESNLIKKLKPPFNVAGKDDRSSWYIAFSADRPTRIHLVRAKEVPTLRRAGGTHGPGAKFFGPYAGVGNMPSVLKALRRIWPHRDCAADKFNRYQKAGRPCLFGEIGLCPAPCQTESADQAANVRQLAAFLSGRRRGLIGELAGEMNDLARRQQYEQAAVLRDRLFALEHMQQLVKRGLLDGGEDRRRRLLQGIVVEGYDISHNQGAFAVGVLVRAIVPRDHRGIPLTKPSEITLTKERYRKYRIKWAATANDSAMIAEVLTRRCRRAIREPVAWSLPDLFLIDGGTAQLAAARQAVKTAGLTVPVVAVAKGPTRKKTDLYWRPADESRLPLPLPGLQAVAWLLREEAHRFAVSYYRQTHRRALLS